MNKVIKIIENQKDRISTAILLLCAWLGVYGVCYVSTLFAADYFSYGAVALFAYVLIFVALKITYKDLAQIEDKKERRKRVLYAYVFAFLFAVSMILGYQLRMSGMTESGVRGKGLIILRGMCLAICVFPFTNVIFRWIEKIHSNKGQASPEKMWKSKNVFLFSWAAIFLCWIPVFLAYYPAVMSYDFHRQSIEAANGFVWFNSYQPLAHTWLIWVAFQIGNALGSLQTGMAFFTVFQMLVFSAACGYSCVTVYRLVKKRWPVLLMVLFLGVFPFVSVLAVCTTKDVLFSALFLVFMCLFVERFFLCDPRKQKVIDILWVLEGIVMMLFRNNAIYAVAVFAAFYLVLGAKKQKLRILVMCLVLVVGGKAALEGMQIVIGTEGRGSKIEMFSVPLQTFARVGYFHGGEMDEETEEIFDIYMPAKYWELYNPTIADPVKSWVGAEVYPNTWQDNIPDMLVAWAKVGLKYPNEYIDAFLLLNSGYWFMDDKSWAEVLGYGLEDRYGAIYTYTSSTSDAIPEGIAHESKFPALESLLENIVSANCYYDWPIVSNLFKPALYCWLLLLTIIACLYTRQKKKLLVTLLPFAYLGTMFLGPVVQARYILPIIVIMPLMLGMFAGGQENKAVETDKVA